MKRVVFLYLLFMSIIIAVGLSSCENYSKGERVGYITQFSETGLAIKTYEGHLNTTQTGMNSSQGFDFSVEIPTIASEVEQALKQGQRVKLTYHETRFVNWFRYRGETNYFVTGVQVLDSIK